MSAAHTSSANVDATSDILTLVLHNQQHNALQDAETFSRLLCANKQLRSGLLAAAAGRLALSWPIATLAEHKQRSMALWLQQHLQLQTIKQLQLLQDLSQAPMDDFDAMVAGAMQLDKRQQAFCSRVAGVLGSAAAFLGSQQQLPKISGWFGHDLPAASLSLLPGGHLTQLVLNLTSLDTASAHELAAMTSLRELRLPLLCPAPAALGPALAALTCLTGLLLVDPAQEVLGSIPASVQELMLMRGAVGPASKLRLSHLAQLHTLRLAAIGALSIDTRRLLDAAGAVDFWEGVPVDGTGGYLEADAVLPAQLQRLVAGAIKHARPLLQLQQLAHVQLTASPRDSDLGQFRQLTALTQLTRMELLQQGWDADLHDLFMYKITFRGLPLHIPSLRMGIPSTAEELAIGTPAEALQALGALTSLTRLELHRKKARRAAAILEAAAVAGGNGVGAGAWAGTVRQLAGAVSQLTNLVVLELRQVPAKADGVGGLTVGRDWLPLTDAVAALPRLEDLRFEGMPLSESVPRLPSAKHLTSLALVNCGVDDVVFMSLVRDMTCSSSLRSLTVAAPATGTPGARLTKAVLPVIMQLLQGLRVLKLPGHSLPLNYAAQLTRLPNLSEIEVGTREMGLVNKDLFYGIPVFEDPMG